MKPAKVDDPFAVLTSTVPAVDTKAALALLRGVFGMDGDLEPLTSERDQNFRVSLANGERYVLKFANSAENPSVTDFQSRAMVHIGGAVGSVAVPQVVPAKAGDWSVVHETPEGNTHVVRLLSWLDGVPLQHCERAPRYATTLGHCLAMLGNALQDFTHPASDYALLWDLKRAAVLRKLLQYVDDEALQALCAERLDIFESRVAPRLDSVRWQVIHNDLNPSNALVDPTDTSTVTGIIDFGDIVRSPLIVDVAVAAAYLVQDDADPLADVEEFLQAYCERCPLLDDEVELLQDLLFTRSTMTVLITHWRASRHPENREYILRNEQRARRVLNRLQGLQSSETAHRFRRACGLQQAG